MTSTNKRSKINNKSSEGCNSDKDTKICIVAGDKILKNDKVFRPYLTLVNINTTDVMKINHIKKDTELFITENVKPDKNGKYVGKYSRIKSSNKTNDILVEGGIEILKRNLHEYLTDKYGKNLIKSYQPAHVHICNAKNSNLGNIPLYQNFDLLQLSIECD